MPEIVLKITNILTQMTPWFWVLLGLQNWWILSISQVGLNLFWNCVTLKRFCYPKFVNQWHKFLYHIRRSFWNTDDQLNDYHKVDTILKTLFPSKSLFRSTWTEETRNLLIFVDNEETFVLWDYLIWRQDWQKCLYEKGI